MRKLHRMVKGDGKALRPRPFKFYPVKNYITPAEGTIEMLTYHGHGLRIFSALIEHQRIRKWHLSLSRIGNKRASDDDCKMVLNEFDLHDGREENYLPGVGRNFFMAIDPQDREYGVEIAGYSRIIEPDGYAWYCPHAQALCQACKSIMYTCPVHKRNGQSDQKGN